MPICQWFHYFHTSYSIKPHHMSGSILISYAIEKIYT
jgi:hypothetical protein